MNEQTDSKNIAADVIYALGGAQKTSDIFGVSRNAVYQWRRRGQIPPLQLAAALLLLQSQNSSKSTANARESRREKRTKPPAMAAMRARRRW